MNQTKHTFCHLLSVLEVLCLFLGFINRKQFTKGVDGVQGKSTAALPGIEVIVKRILALSVAVGAVSVGRVSGCPHSLETSVGQMSLSSVGDDHSAAQKVDGLGRTHTDTTI